MRDITFSTGDLKRACNLTNRQLQWWDEQKIVVPKIIGHKRVYSTEQGLLIAVMAEVRKKGVSLQHLVPLRSDLKSTVKEGISRIKNGETNLYCAMDPSGVLLWRGAQGVIYHAVKQPYGIYVVDVGECLQKILAARKVH